ncbi:PP2C family serine/threonine-protein phosphatase [Streptomyces sp. NPDC047453]|uniref:PP2C family serine/threonine-protein phosphatase n=1 Tax=Streptomyces sp. NPDC047453 TaxID=3154812 RepID=UPI0033E0B26A
MSQMHQQAALPKCPSCAEPLESGDRFCGACGYDLSAAAEGPGDAPTLTMDRGAVPRPAGPGERADDAVWPRAPHPDASEAPPRLHLPTDLPGTDSSGSPLPAPAQQAQAQAQSQAQAAVQQRPQPVAQSPQQPQTAQSQPQPEAQPPAEAQAAVRPQPQPAAQPPRQAQAQQQPQAQAQAAVQQQPQGQGQPQPQPQPQPQGQGPQPQGQPQQQGASASGVRLDRPAEPDEYPLQAPDPRVPTDSDAAAPGEGAAGDGTPGETATVCVACRAGRVDSDGYCENCGHAQPRERDHMEQESGPIAAVSDRGLRHHRNEDAFALGRTALPDGSPALAAVVCDGVSSATRPDDASLAASRAASESLLAALPRGTHPQQAMHDAIVAAAQAVDALAGEPASAGRHSAHQNAPACTFVGAVVASGLLVVGWVGDSRAYWIPVDRGAPPARLTEDDSWAAQMVSAGLMSEAEAYADERAHAITGWLGADAYELEPHTASFKPDRPGVVVVCTDGLWNYAETAREMAEAVPPDAAVRPLHSARVLVGHALDGGGHDNVTVAVVPFPAAPQGAGSA